MGYRSHALVRPAEKVACRSPATVALPVFGYGAGDCRAAPVPPCSHDLDLMAPTTWSPSSEGQVESTDAAPSGTNVRPRIDLVKYAESFGAHGFMIQFSGPRSRECLSKQLRHSWSRTHRGTRGLGRDNHNAVLFELVE